MTIDEDSISNAIIRLNVGGTRYTRPREILEKCHKLKKLFASGILNEKNEIFIDCDGFIFRHILQYLLTGEIHLENVGYLQELKTKKLTKIYRLIEEQELNTLAILDPNSNEYISKSTIVKDFQMIGTVKYLRHISYNCPRDIPVHKSCSDCGKKCRSAREPDHVYHTYQNAKKYLVTYKE